MSGPRAARAGRLVDLRSRDVTEAQAKLGEASRRLLEAIADAAAAERAWTTSADDVTRCVSTAELAERSLYLTTLRRRADQATTRVMILREEEDRRRRALHKARIEQRKIELWQEGILRGLADDEKRIDRMASDEIAARITQRAR